MGKKSKRRKNNTKASASKSEAQPVLAVSEPPPADAVPDDGVAVGPPHLVTEDPAEEAVSLLSEEDAVLIPESDPSSSDKTTEGGAEPIVSVDGGLTETVPEVEVPSEPTVSGDNTMPPVAGAESVLPDKSAGNPTEPALPDDKVPPIPDVGPAALEENTAKPAGSALTDASIDEAIDPVDDCAGVATPVFSNASSPGEPPEIMPMLNSVSVSEREFDTDSKGRSGTDGTTTPKEMEDAQKGPGPIVEKWIDRKGSSGFLYPEGDAPTTATFVEEELSSKQLAIDQPTAYSDHTIKSTNRRASREKQPPIASLFVPLSTVAPAPSPQQRSQSPASSTTGAGYKIPPRVARDSTDGTVASNLSKRSSKGSKKTSKPAIMIPAVMAQVIVNGEPVNNRVRLGICAMDKKARSKPMAEILSRLDKALFHVVFFGDVMIREQPVEDWPIVDVLIAFYSAGYPLEKAESYVELRKPFVLNDLNSQRTLMDRRKVYDLLAKSGIDVPRHVYMCRDGYSSDGPGVGNGENNLVEHDDHIELNGIVINKPFVEKPVDADDHNIAIYYPTTAGGGCKKLFRKVGNRSSEFYPEINEVRRDGSYIYEEFVETQGTDVKMYTVSCDYGHAEARKSPTVDGKVERNADGKEVRFPVILTLREKEIARRIVIVFKQQVCGFDLLRVQEGDSLVSYVCDVNGFSFVKNSRKYYDDCAQILTEHMLAAVKPMALRCFSTLEPLMATMQDEKSIPDTPKQRRRKQNTMLQRASRILQGDQSPPTEIPGNGALPNGSPVKRIENGNDPDSPRVSNSVSAATTLEEGAIPVREIPDMLMQEPASLCASAESSVVDENEMNQKKKSTGQPGFHQEELRCVIAVIRHGDRTPKQKLKVNMGEPLILDYFHKHCKNPRKDLKVKDKAPMIEFLDTVKTMIAEKDADGKAKRKTKTKERSLINKEKDMLYQLRHMRDILERWKISGLNRKLQMKPKKTIEVEDKNGQKVWKCTELQLILKWGGNLTKLGERQAVTLGQRLRHEMYPDAPGGGILRLHSTFRHDLKIKTSDEGRVMKTAAAFAKGLLELEGEIPPILVSLVHKEKDSLHMLDPSGNKDVQIELDACKEKININLQKDVDFDAVSESEHESIVGPASLQSLHNALKKVGNPRKTLIEIHNLIDELLVKLDDMLGGLTSGDEDRNEDGEGLQSTQEEDEALSGIKLYKGETLLELTERWRLLYKKMYDEDKDVFDLSRIPDVHDNVRFDMLHNPHIGLTGTLEKLYNLAKLMADCVVPQEYGTTIEEKRSIGNKMCRALLQKIKFDLIIAQTDNKADMRYMINMDYSADLPINTMGRRIRTRLYFTSESHLHTLLNVMRFALTSGEAQRSLLSKRGHEIINQTPELCYLTQVVLRLFEDPKKDIDDPKRFRIEILFSSGATSTPSHMAEMDRELDSARFDTSPLTLISKENLTFSEVEEFFSESIEEGRTPDDEESDDKFFIEKDWKLKSMRSLKEVVKEKKDVTQDILPSIVEPPSLDQSITSVDNPVLESNDDRSLEDKNLLKADSTISAELDRSVSAIPEEEDSPAKDTADDSDISEAMKCRALVSSVGIEDRASEEDEEERIKRMATVLARRYLVNSFTIFGLVFGVGGFIIGRSLKK